MDDRVRRRIERKVIEVLESGSTAGSGDVGGMAGAIEIPIDDVPASELGELLHELADRAPDVNILIGALTYAVDPETNAVTAPPGWRSLAISGPAKAILGIGGNRLAEWADTATRRSRIIMIANGLTVKVY